MITISRERAMEIFRAGRLPKDLIDKGISVIMPKNDAHKWFYHLESGRQKQADGVLYDPKDRSFCCLGLEQSCNWGGKVESRKHDDKVVPAYMPSLEYLKETAKMYYSLDGCETLDPALRGRGEETASTMNDNGNSFKEIAKVLRKCTAVY